MIKKVSGWMERNEWLLIILTFVVLLRIPSLFEPYWYGDEGIYLAIGQALRKGAVLYSQVHDNKPPFLYLIAALANGRIYWFKFLAGIFNLLSIGVFHKLADKLSGGNKKKTVIATAIFALLTTLPLMEGNIANAELFFVLFTVGAFYLLWKQKNNWQIFTGGLILGLGVLFKMPPILEAGVWPIYWLIIREKQWLKKSVILGLGVLLPVLISMGVMFGLGAGREYLTAAWTQNIPYLTTWKATSDATGIYSLKIRAWLLVIGLGAIFIWGKKWHKSTILICLWTVIAWFASLLSGRPYPHYLLQMAPVMALWIIWGRKSILGWFLVVTTWAAFQFYIYPVWGYYENFGSYIFGFKTYDQYLSHFDPQTIDNYRIAETIVTNTDKKDKIFIWGDQSMIYAISERMAAGKYLAKYHIDSPEAKKMVLSSFDKTPPKMIVFMDDQEDWQDLWSLSREKYLLIGKIGNAQLWKAGR